jgi:hypothetical protein
MAPYAAVVKPAEQLLQLVAPEEGWNFPIEHGLQGSVPSGEKWPAPQGRLQAEEEDEPAARVTRPAGHWLQVEEPEPS